MSSIYNKADNDLIISRIHQLTPESKALWGKMTVDQMLSHCQAPLDFAFGKIPMKANFLMRMIGKLVRNKILSSKEYKRNSPTAPAFIRKGTYDFEQAKNGLIERINIFSEQGQNAIKTTKHPFFGEMTYEEWSQMHTMHLDHHLRQFGV
ncbi:DUF1569 domain-containing protein [Flavobacterium sp. J49]|uniref:DUF1569 domain-containing protein n=1 Tax=Flavobacterium sp. J49 TaxID=2718534 RepID=UPI001593B1AC|nr:DUF1569 domain-containing protein [Flavobacterium sp. J49]MBF6640988.1 DUF1569 domain-containing protein [Flavobacterium sp. J49]NIC02235.1 DUF1569 domain-containing protein [Flavobacterium sp. J49]